MTEEKDPEDVAKVVVGTIKSGGLFDQFRRECIEALDKMEQYRQLQKRVENHVASFLSRQRWSEGLSKNKLRENLRQHINQSEVILNGVQHIINEVLYDQASSFNSRIDLEVDKYLDAQRAQEKLAEEKEKEKAENNSSKSNRDEKTKPSEDCKPSDRTQQKSEPISNRTKPSSQGTLKTARSTDHSDQRALATKSKQETINSKSSPTEKSRHRTTENKVSSSPVEQLGAVTKQTDRSFVNKSCTTSEGFEKPVSQSKPKLESGKTNSPNLALTPKVTSNKPTQNIKRNTSNDNITSLREDTVGKKSESDQEVKLTVKRMTSEKRPREAGEKGQPCVSGKESSLPRDDRRIKTENIPVTDESKTQVVLAALASKTIGHSITYQKDSAEDSSFRKEKTGDNFNNTNGSSSGPANVTQNSGRRNNSESLSMTPMKDSNYKCQGTRPKESENIEHFLHFPSSTSEESETSKIEESIRKIEPGKYVETVQGDSKAQCGSAYSSMATEKQPESDKCKIKASAGGDIGAMKETVPTTHNVPSDFQRNSANIGFHEDIKRKKDVSDDEEYFDQLNTKKPKYSSGDLSSNTSISVGKESVHSEVDIKDTKGNGPNSPIISFTTQEIKANTENDKDESIHKLDSNTHSRVLLTSNRDLQRPSSLTEFKKVVERFEVPHEGERNFDLQGESHVDHQRESNADVDNEVSKLLNDANTTIQTRGKRSRTNSEECGPPEQIEENTEVTVDNIRRKKRERRMSEKERDALFALHTKRTKDHSSDTESYAGIRTTRTRRISREDSDDERTSEKLERGRPRTKKIKSTEERVISTGTKVVKKGKKPVLEKTEPCPVAVSSRPKRNVKPKRCYSPSENT